jgi:hypothetical protein
LADDTGRNGLPRLRFEEGTVKKGGLNPPPTDYRPPPPQPFSPQG